MNPFPILIRIAAGFVLATLAACGGGGGGGGGGGQGALVYSGNTSQAVVTTTNASKLTANVIGGDDAASIIAGVSAESGNAAQNPGSGTVDISRLLSGSFRDAASRTKLISSAQQAALVQIDDTQPCDGGNGTIRVFGTIDDVTGTGTVTVIFSSCLLAGVTVNGQATMRIDAFDLAFFVPTDFTMSFARLTLRATGLSLDAGGSLRDQINISTNTEMLTADLVQLDNNTSLITKSANLVIVSVYNNILAPTSFTATITGQVFDSVHGFVDVTTITPAAFGTLNQLFPDSGQIMLAGTNSTVLVTALNSTLVELQLDTNGDSTVDNTARLRWDQLSGPVGSDLGDTDGDGMPNSWETANGMNPNIAADAALDNDSDGARNFLEYLAGTDPNSASSIPPFPGQIVNLANNSDLIFDSVTQKIYAAIRGDPGAITPVDPTTGKIGTAIPVGIDPVKLARSDNGQYLYVGLDGANAVQRIDLATQMVNLTFSLGNNLSLNPLYVDDIEVLPGSPQSVAIARKKKGFSPRHEGVAIYDDGVQRATATSTFTGSNVIEFSASADTLYGYTTEVVPARFIRMAVNSSGVSILDETQNLINDLGDIEFDGGIVYSTGGSVTNPQTLTADVPFSGLPGIPFTKSVRPDASIGRVFFLIQTALDQIGQTATISAFNLNTRTLINSVTIPGIAGDPGNLIRWGAKGLAFRTSGGQIFLIESTNLIP